MRESERERERERERRILRFGGSTHSRTRLGFSRRAESIFVVRGFFATAIHRCSIRRVFFHLSRSAIPNVIMLTTTATTICFVLASLLLFGVECQNGAWTLGEK